MAKVQIPVDPYIYMARSAGAGLVRLYFQFFNTTGVLTTSDASPVALEVIIVLSGWAEMVATFISVGIPASMPVFRALYEKCVGRRRSQSGHSSDPQPLGLATIGGTPMVRSGRSTLLAEGGRQPPWKKHRSLTDSMPTELSLSSRPGSYQFN